ncbi:MAG: hypothetical protein ACFCUI_08745 [Bernardetiaceae bacterium]
MKKILLFPLLLCLWGQALAQTDSTRYPNVSIGTLVHLVGVGLQDRPSAAQEAAPGYSPDWQTSFNVYRARILLGVAISPKTNFFMETEIPQIIGRPDATGQRLTQIRPIILDAQVEHRFSEALQLIAGLQLVGITRNQLQGAASLLALDFGYFQYLYSLFDDQPLQNNFGRDIGINLRGFVANQRLEYRLGIFNGRHLDDQSQLRYIARLNYNFWEREKGQYYTGTSLGQNRYLALGLGADIQASYHALGGDLFLDMPLGEQSALTLQGAFTYMSGGEGAFAALIPRQTVQFVELGYYLRPLHLMPYLKYENQRIDALPQQNTSVLPLPDFNTLQSNQRAGIGLGYFFEGYRANLKASYEAVRYGRNQISEQSAESKTIGEVWLQLQFFFF